MSPDYFFLASKALHLRRFEKKEDPMENPSSASGKTIVYDKNRIHGVFVLTAKSDNQAVLDRFQALGFSFLGYSDLAHRQADVFAQSLLTPDREEHLLCLTPMVGNASAVLSGGQNVLAFGMPLSLYRERKSIFERYIGVSTQFFTAENRDAHSLVDQADALLAQFR
jgi:hypothetical protein